MKQRAIIILGFILSTLSGFSQETFPVNGVHDRRPNHYAFTNANIVVDHETTIQKGTMVINNGVIQEVGTEVTIPGGARVIDMKGKYVYPSFIDMYSTYGMPLIKKVKKVSRENKKAQMLSNKRGAFGWNQAIKPEIKAVDLFKTDTAKARKLRNLGFGTVMSFHNDGIVRGSSVLVTLANENENEVIIVGKVAGNLSFNKGTSTQNYPSSLMGKIALINQTFADGMWYEQENNQEEYNISLAAWNELQYLPLIDSMFYVQIN